MNLGERMGRWTRENPVNLGVEPDNEADLSLTALKAFFDTFNHFNFFKV